MKRLLLLFSILFLTGCSGGLFSKEPKAFVEATDLGLAYEEDESSASSEYDDEYIQVTGIIKFIIEENDEVKLQLFGDVICSITDDIESTIDLKKYNMVILNGTVDGLGISGNVTTLDIDDCELIEVVTTPEIVTTSENISSLNLGELGCKVIEITGVINSFDFYNSFRLKLINDEIYDYGIEFEVDFDLSALEEGDTITVTGVVMPYDSYLLPNGYLIFGYEISNIIKAN